jgi:hypothetical protein
LREDEETLPEGEDDVHRLDSERKQGTFKEQKCWTSLDLEMLGARGKGGGQANG